jgi:hypothetical protein
MTDVIQIFKYKELFTKDNYTPENRRQLEKLPEQIISSQGFFEQDSIFLPKFQKENLKVKKPELLLIQDLLEHQIAGSERVQRSRREFREAWHRQLYVFEQLKGRKAFELFKLEKVTADRCDLFLDYESNAPFIGIPERQEHKLGELRPGEAIRFRINGKSDFSLFGRRERSFHEFDYVIQWLGTAERIQFMDQNKIEKTKKLPQELVNLVDERKLLR